MAKGCNIGNQVITGATGTYVMPYEPYREIYNGDTYTILYNGMAKQPNTCYISNPYNFNLEGCRANGMNGSVINYGQSQILCTPPTVQVPLDVSIMLHILMILLGLFGGYKLGAIKHKTV